MDEQLKTNLLSSKHWLRLLYMLLFALCLQLAGLVMWVLVGLQFLFALVSGQDNPKLRAFGDSLSRYIYDTLQFVSYNSESKPFPFSDWPEIREKEAPLEGEVEEAEHAASAFEEAEDIITETDAEVAEVEKEIAETVAEAERKVAEAEKEITDSLEEKGKA